MLKSIIGRSKSEKHITFEYTGNNEEDIPNNATHVRVLPGVTKIEDRAFQNRVSWKALVYHPPLTRLEQWHSCNAIV